MSLLWNDRVTLVLLGDHALLRRQSGSWGRKTTDSLTVEITGEDRIALLSAIQQKLAEAPGWKRPANVTVILGNSWVRYATLPWAEGLLQRDERLAYAKLGMRKHFGNGVDQWEIRLSEGGYGDPWLAAGVARDLIADLDAFAATQNWKITAIQPALMTVANGFTERLAQGPVRLALVEKNRVVLARLDAGAWRDVRTRKTTNSGGLGHLEGLLAQEALLDPDDLGTTSRLCIWAFDVPSELRMRWHAFGADVLDGRQAVGPYLSWRAR